MADDPEPPPDSKLTRSKQRWAQEGRFLTGKVARADEQRLPPGQHLTKDWPTLDLGLTPEISEQRWHLDVYGAVDTPVFWSLSGINHEGSPISFLRASRPKYQPSRNPRA